MRYTWQSRAILTHRFSRRRTGKWPLPRKLWGSTYARSRKHGALQAVAGEKSNTIVFPLSIDLIKAFVQDDGV